MSAKRSPLGRWFINALLVVGIGLTAWRFLPSRLAPEELDRVPRERLYAGSTLVLDPRRPSALSGAVIAVVQTKCPGSNASATFYSELASRVRAAGVAFVVIGDESTEAIAKWLDDKDIGPAEILAVPKLAGIGVVVTPTVLRVDRKGLVTDIVSGRLTPAEEQRFFKRIGDMGPPLVRLTYARLIRERDVEAIIAASRVVVLDVRDRAAFAAKHRAGAINIPRAVSTIVRQPDSAFTVATPSS